MKNSNISVSHPTKGILTVVLLSMALAEVIRGPAGSVRAAASTNLVIVLSL
ncbi:hypothetical protein [Paenibacillus polymyxa]|uniref:hypothetical protein n=1 Tax=Paenibacillus polymyxa TaxID=1406 RepID=UPI0002E258E8|nr:hypothetical protein [Paenibacillus polymyxa]